MTKNLNLIRRTKNRTSNRPPQSPLEDKENKIQNEKYRQEEKRFFNEKQQDNDDYMWNNLREKLYFPVPFLDTDWRLSLSTIFKVKLNLYQNFFSK